MRVCKLVDFGQIVVIAAVCIGIGYQYFAAFYRAGARELKRLGLSITLRHTSLCSAAHRIQTPCFGPSSIRISQSPSLGFQQFEATARSTDFWQIRDPISTLKPGQNSSVPQINDNWLSDWTFWVVACAWSSFCVLTFVPEQVQEDAYRMAGPVGGRLFLHRFNSTKLAIRLSDIVCHFSLLRLKYPFSDAGRDCIHVLPLDRVSASVMYSWSCLNSLTVWTVRRYMPPRVRLQMTWTFGVGMLTTRIEFDTLRCCSFSQWHISPLLSLLFSLLLSPSSWGRPPY